MAENLATETVIPETEDLEVQIREDAAATPSSDNEELDSYTKNVSKRINKLNDRTRAMEERAIAAEMRLAERDAQFTTLNNQNMALGQTLFAKEEESIKTKEQQADQLYKKAVEAGDAELMSKADTLKSDVSIQKEKIRLAKQTRQPQQFQGQPVQQQQAAPPQFQPSQNAQPTSQAADWHARNNWYGNTDNPEHLEATKWAYFNHYNLINEGYEADSQDYYSELNDRISKFYPHLSEGADSGQNVDKPAVQRVASASIGSRNKTRSKKNGVSFTKSEIERLQGLKPHNMSQEQWLKSVAKEKQKIAQREAL